MSIDPAKETAMSITINRRTTRELQDRRKAIYDRFKDAGDPRDLATTGALSTNERCLYDELVRIESLLNS